jgi:stage II sporulation protein M
MKFWFMGVTVLFAVCLAVGLLLSGPVAFMPDSLPNPDAGIPNAPPGTDAVIPETLPGSSALLQETLDELGTLFEMLAGLPPIVMALFILVNNAITLIFSFGFAPLLGLVPLFVVGFNGWLIGVVVAGIIQTQGVGYAVRGLLPHGIIEIPAFLFGEAVALSFAVALLGALFNAERRQQLFPAFVRHIKMLGIAAALLVPAALIEVFVTARLLGV